MPITGSGDCSSSRETPGGGGRPGRGGPRDAHGFALHVSPEDYAVFEQHYRLVQGRQLRLWTRISAFGAPALGQMAETVAAAGGGMPPALRPRLWLHFSTAAAMRRDAGAGGAFEELLRGAPSRKEERAAFDAAAKQIELDLPRTFPEHAAFASADGLAALRRVLLAHARRHPAVGYAQSLNFLAAFLLLQVPPEGVALADGHCGREEAAFWLLCAITTRLLPEHYTAEMIGVRVDCLVVDDALAADGALRPALAVLRGLDLDLSIVSTQWLLLAFVNGLPTDTTLRVWDLFFVVGSRALLAAAVAVVRVLRAPLLAADRHFERADTAHK